MTTAASQSPPDYYAVLQVHPSADMEVIEAAYRQLMKKHHPDVAGDDPARVAAHHERSKIINKAFSVLRDPDQRRRYDDLRYVRFGQSSPYAAPPPPPAASAPPRTSAPPTTHAQAEPADIAYEDAGRARSPWPGPFGVVAEAYYLLPGKYEWEAGQQREILSAVLLPIVGVAGFCLASGRLSPWIGHTLNATLLAWALLGIATLPLWPALPRVVLAAVPSLALLSGALTPLLLQANVPAWLAWTVFALLGLLLAARLYVFSVLPMLATCWLIASFT
jgi:hypothetical protein